MCFYWGSNPAVVETDGDLWRLDAVYSKCSDRNSCVDIFVKRVTAPDHIKLGIE